MDEEETQGWDVVETPPVYEVVRPRYVGLTPRGVVVAIAAVSLVASLVAFATGAVAVGILLLVAAGLLAALYLEQARRRRESSLDRVAAAAVDHTKALAGFTGASVRAWTSAGREVAKLRLEAHTRARERSQLQYALGRACYDGDEPQIANLKDQMRLCTDRIDACAAEAQAVLDRTRQSTSRDRASIAPTEIRR
jgi:hypothetical protein